MIGSFAKTIRTSSLIIPISYLKAIILVNHKGPEVLKKIKMHLDEGIRVTGGKPRNGSPFVLPVALYVNVCPFDVNAKVALFWD